jgi:hypothetical protein
MAQSWQHLAAQAEKNRQVAQQQPQADPEKKTSRS